MPLKRLPATDNPFPAKTMHPRSLPLPLPELASGDRLTREEFERRYAAIPYLKKAELIVGLASF